MTDQEVQKAFDEVYNKFWLNYHNKPIPKQSDEWERCHTWAVVLMKKYPFMEQLVAEMMAEIDQRMRKRENV
ncbi:hypothetical protein [Lacrimispora sp.]|jgi:hypothetical protein|uniref:hypothetical protein n=1 Tax=Lacrimispora sp. TaxID=2719234 RepID=UPI0028AEFB12|nr:hypothetical protein [Lacrimispora sp.]